MKKMLSMEMSSQVAVKFLKAIVDECQKHIQALKSIPVGLNMFLEIMLINVILKKVDKETKKK